MNEGRSRWHWALIALLGVFVVLLFAVSLAVGPVSLPLETGPRVLIGQGNEVATIIVREIRLPRAILAVLIGGTLGLAGAALQGLLRNPLAAP
jgi:iron complex transport system permease protein